MQGLDVLILGAGWTATFLIPLLQERRLRFAATTRDGREVSGVPTIRWGFDPADNGAPAAGAEDQFARLPLAKLVLITFPLTGPGQSATLVHGYARAQGKPRESLRFVQLGSTGIWQVAQPSCWVDRASPYDTSNARAVAEDELRALGGAVLNLAGLWGGQRDPRGWVDRVAKTKEQVRGKKSLHLIHGLDVARAIVAIMSGDWENARGQRWMLTDGFVYDWWSLMAAWADVGGGDEQRPVTREPSSQAQWVYELMREDNIPALPRSMEALGRCYDSREFWTVFQLAPLKAGV